MRLACVTCYFNPAGYLALAENYRHFSERLIAQGVDLFTVEHAVGNTPFRLPAGDRTFQLRGGDILWQKERLLGYAINRLPSSYDAVAWLDCDILFPNDNWAEAALRSLESVDAVQLYDTQYFLPPGHCEFRGTWVRQWFGAIKWVRSEDSEAVRSRLALGILDGNPGLAWAARRALLKAVPLPDRHILGSGDYYQVCAMLDVRHNRPVSPAQETYLFDHAARVRKAAPTISYLSQPVLHLWHGSLANRKYQARAHLLKQHDYRPLEDVEVRDGLLCWSSDKPIFHDDVRRYFERRAEDG